MDCRTAASTEPLVGTAPYVATWLIVEHPGPWSAKAPQAVPQFAALSDSDVTVIFARRPRQRTHGHRYWIAREGMVHQGSGASVDQLVALAQDPALTGNSDESTMFVCTNGKRDVCCATYGRALATTLEDERVWECTHLGGHRFAPTALLLPSGMVLGRLTVDAAQAALEGEPVLHTMRGCSYLPRREQAAQLLGTQHLEEHELPPRPESCGGAATPGSYFTIAKSSSR